MSSDGQVHKVRLLGSGRTVPITMRIIGPAGLDVRAPMGPHAVESVEVQRDDESIEVVFKLANLLGVTPP